MDAQYTPCQACGAVGEVNKKCQFCGTTIMIAEDAITSDARIVHKRNVTPQKYAEKISIYHDVQDIRYNTFVKKVRIGHQLGVINENGDVIYPLGQYDDIVGHSPGVIKVVMGKRTHGLSYYVSLDTLETTDSCGFCRDIEYPNRLHLINVNSGWVVNNECRNLSGEKFIYDYAEKMKSPNINISDIYVLHRDDDGALWVWGAELPEDEFPSNAMPVLDGIKSIGKIRELRQTIVLPIRLLNGKVIDLTLARKEYDEEDGDSWWESCDADEIVTEWCVKVRGRVIKSFSTENNIIEQTPQETNNWKFVLGLIVFACVFIYALVSRTYSLVGVSVVSLIYILIERFRR